ncbi:hypothetical protein DJ68_17385 [Halorubrum sp. C3]|nr:hypothetical protein DJ68_17385 [Halorubrum sp. C3]
MTEDLTEIDGVGDAIAEQLREAGFDTVADVEDATVDELADVHMLGEASAKAILNGDDVGHRGRPSEFTDQRARAAIEAAREGKSKAGCERDAGVADGTIGNWLDADPTFTDANGDEKQFFRAFRRARGDGESLYIVQGRDPDGDVEAPFAKYMLSTSYEYKKTEKQEVEHSGKIDGERTLGDDELAAIRRGLSVSEGSDL